MNPLMAFALADLARADEQAIRRAGRRMLNRADPEVIRRDGRWADAIARWSRSSQETRTAQASNGADRVTA